MRILAIFCFLSAALPLALSCQSSGTDSARVVTEIEALRDTARQAWLRGDLTTIERLWADDYVSTSSRGEVRTKRQALDAMRAGKRRFVALDYDEVVVRPYGTSAVETGRVRYVLRTGDQQVSGEGRYTLVFVKRYGRWQVVAHHVSSISPPS